MHREIQPDARSSALRDAGPDRQPDPQSRAREREHGRESIREHALLSLRGSFLRVSAEELATMRDVGCFRAVDMKDLERFRYLKRAGELAADVRALTAQGLARPREIEASPGKPALRVLVLTKRGQQALEAHGRQGVDAAKGREPQAFYSGLVKRNEVRHDTAIYRMFQAERARIEKDGGRVRRVVLDYELKKLVYTPLAKARGISPKDYAALQAQVARATGLTVVRGKIPLPDLRIEFETRSGEAARVDLELATEHYHGRSLAEKAQAGFSFYAADGSADRLFRALEERDITVAILSL